MKTFGLDSVNLDKALGLSSLKDRDSWEFIESGLVFGLLSLRDVDSWAEFTDNLGLQH